MTTNTSFVSTAAADYDRTEQLINVIVKPSSCFHSKLTTENTSGILTSNTKSDTSKARKLDQFYTTEVVAKELYDFTQPFLNDSKYLMVEPSAGKGAFSKLFPPENLAFEIDAKCAGIIEADFLTVTLPTGRNICVIGNPPFGKRCSMALQFFNHAAFQSNVIAFILPKTFRKSYILNKLDRNMHLVAEKDVKPLAFIFQGKPRDVPTIFQIWERRDYLRELEVVEIKHPDFSFTTRDKASFAIQRIGTNAGRIHHNFKLSATSNYFIAGDVEDIMRTIDFSRVAKDTAGFPSVAKYEIVRLFREKTGR
jgi:hypothetical protein